MWFTRRYLADGCTDAVTVTVGSSFWILGGREGGMSLVFSLS